jgi:general secretion pathway protein C
MLFTSSRLPLILATVAGIAMIAVTALQGVRFWQIETSAGDAMSATDLSMAEAEARDVPDVNLASFALFGEAGKEIPKSEPDTENLPETNLRLFLRGVLAASGDFPGSALVEDDKRNTEAYLVGDELPGNATLRSVRANRIIIERDGKLENLYFPEDEDTSGLSMASTQASEDEEERGDTQIRSSGADRRSSSANAGTSDQRREEIRQRLEQLRERLRANN